MVPVLKPRRGFQQRALLDCFEEVEKIWIHLNGHILLSAAKDKMLFLELKWLCRCIHIKSVVLDLFDLMPREPSRVFDGFAELRTSQNYCINDFGGKNTHQLHGRASGGQHTQPLMRSKVCLSSRDAEWSLANLGIKG